MRGPLSMLAALLLAACASPAPAPTTPAASAAASEPPTVDCSALEDALCDSVVEAAELMTGTAALSVAVLAPPSDGGTTMEERYVVTLEAEDGEPGSQLVEVVRFDGSENWSVRRLEGMPAD